MYHGMLNVYKERGFTSHDVVAKLRGITKQKKIGHTGTLDPEAEGVLPVCLGKGTKLCGMLTDMDKTYEAVLLLGTETDTQDVTGTVLRTQAVTVTGEAVREAMDAFLGEQMQIPPMYSALKQNGKKLYELARAGVTVARKPRAITIHMLEITDISLPYVHFLVTCSKGTYIRTLCADIGAKLGCGGCMQSLTRVRVGQFDVKDSLTLSQIQTLCREDALADALYPIDSFFAELPAVHTSASADAAAHNGNAVQPALTDCINASAGRLRLYDSANRFVGVFAYDGEAGSYVPVKMFWSNS